MAIQGKKCTVSYRLEEKKNSAISQGLRKGHRGELFRKLAAINFHLIVRDLKDDIEILG